MIKWIRGGKKWHTWGISTPFRCNVPKYIEMLVTHIFLSFQISAFPFRLHVGSFRTFCRTKWSKIFRTSTQPLRNWLRNYLNDGIRSLSGIFSNLTADFTGLFKNMWISSTRKIQKYLWDFRWNFLCFSLFTSLHFLYECQNTVYHLHIFLPPFITFVQFVRTISTNVLVSTFHVLLRHIYMSQIPI